MRKAIKHLHISGILFSMVLGCIILMNISFPTHAAERSGSCGENLTWTLSENTLTILGSGDMTDYADGALAPWFGVAGTIQNIQLSENITSIGNYAFFGCKNVTGITIPDSVTEIGECAFAQCKSLRHIDFGTGVQLLGEGAFLECESLLELSFPESLTEIGEKAFFRCFSLQTVTVPDTVAAIGTSAFSYCTNLVRATINAPITELPGWTFYGCTSLTDVSLASDIVSVGEYVFLLCDSLNGIYTQGGNVGTVHALEKSVYEKEGAPKEGLIKGFEMPASSTAVTDDGKIYTQTTVSENEHGMISVKNKTDYSREQNVTGTVIEAFIKSAEGWMEVSEAVNKELASGNAKSLVLEIYPHGTTIESESLELFIGKPVVLQIVSETNNVWEIDMSQKTLKSFSGQYSLEEMAVKPFEGEKNSEKTVIEVMGETEGKDADSAANGTENSGITYVPYDADAAEQNAISGESHLMDEEGTTYYVTKRSSKWGITGKQFTVYVALWIASAVLIVAVVMLSLNQKKKSREQYEELVKQGEAEDAAAQEALQVELLKEMLNKKD